MVAYDRSLEPSILISFRVNLQITVDRLSNREAKGELESVPAVRRVNEPQDARSH